jgi:hypothetical protein
MIIKTPTTYFITYEHAVKECGGALGLIYGHELLHE